ncbi:hypothetical protein ACJRO7_032230 [Eucalyptus globulus]|uniref:HMA domain-containing protein n=1 Tax=Eucalyptus globulus TaxID=34317 RepID=A0ABD3JJ77_EUCGL
MGKEKKEEEEELKMSLQLFFFPLFFLYIQGSCIASFLVALVEFKVSMHCNACKRTVARTISMIEDDVGVEKFSMDMNQHKVVVTGGMDLQKVLKKLKKKDGEENGANDGEGEGGSKTMVAKEQNTVIRPSLLGYCCVEDKVLMMFSDENPNACSVM